MNTRPIKKRSNLRDVAAQANVSVATVSRVLNYPDRVSAKTRDRVNSAIADLKFVPSAAARAINSGRSRMVAALLPTIDSAIYAKLINGVEDRLSGKGLSLMVAQTLGDPELECARAKQLIEIGAEALIVAGVHHSDAFFELIDNAQLPVVAISYFEENGRLPTVGYENWLAAEIAATHLADLGHRKVAVVHGPTDTNDRMRQRCTALKCSKLDVSFDFFQAEMSMEGGFRAVAEILRSTYMPTGILCFSDVIAHGVLSGLHSRDIAVPTHMSVMGMENLPASKFTFPPLTTVRLSVEEMGIKAAELISHWLETGTPQTSVNLPIELIRRASTERAI
ncbi:MAG: LacI family DNA-binding transcriptional regulator [Boseongicola sp.]|nr:MAG: LacI family DNA-binding transcriptional regulator [Boseongicola sp.]